MDDSRSASTTSSGTKRKRTPTPAFYVVMAGRQPGIYQTWAEVQEQTKGFPNSIQKKFATLTEAEAWFKGDTALTSPSKPAKWYAVQVGRKPGVYTDWQQVQPQITGWKRAKHKSFPTEEEAWAFVNARKESTPADSGANFSTATSTRGDLESEPSLSETRKGCKVGNNAPKKQKKNDGSAAVTVPYGDYELGTGPLPQDVEDGFDRTIKFNPVNGKIESKTEDQLNARKWQQTGEYTGPIVIYTDGSSLGNGKVGAVAGVGVYFGKQDPRNISEALIGGRQTNQRAELMAIKRAIDIVPIDRDVVIWSDSNYAIKCVTDWFPSWIEKKWKNTAGKDVMNRDIIEPVIDRIEERKVAGASTAFNWVKGHKNTPGNVAADSLAVNGARTALAELRSQGKR